MSHKKVAAKQEKVVINHNFSIVVPEGYTYSTDKQDINDNRLLVFIKEEPNEYYKENCDEDFSLADPFGAPQCFTLMDGRELGNVDLSDDDVRETLQKYANALNLFHGGEVTTVKESDDIIIYYSKTEEPNTFYVAATSKYCYNGQIWINDIEDNDEKDALIREWLNQMENYVVANAVKIPRKPIKVPTYNENKTVTVNNDIVMPVPDGYKYVDGGDGTNQNWFYLVPEDFDTSREHVDAPFTVAISTHEVSSGEIPTEPRLLDVLNNNMTMTGLLFNNIIVRRFMSTEKCMFFYQGFTDPDVKNYNKFKGYVSGEAGLYHFHAFANYDDDIAGDPRVEQAFEQVVQEWMVGVHSVKDAPYPLVENTSDVVKDVIKDLPGTLEKLKDRLGVFPTYEDELKEHYAKIAAMFFKAHNIPVDAKAVKMVSDMVGTIKGSALTAKTLESYAAYVDVTDDELSFDEDGRLINQTVKADKMAGLEFKDGLTFNYYESVYALLYSLCAQANIGYFDTGFSEKCLHGIRQVINDKWSSTNILTIGANGLRGQGNSMQAPFVNQYKTTVASQDGKKLAGVSATKSATKSTAKPAAKSSDKATSKPAAKAGKSSGNYSFPTKDVPENRKKILTRKPKKTDKPNRYDLYFRPTFETDKFAAKNAPVFYYYCDKVNPGFSDRQKELLAFADTLTTYFGSVGDELREKAIRHGYMKSAYDMHALRSYVWTSLEWCKTNKKELDDISLDGMQALCDLIAKQGGTNYDVIAKGRKHIGTSLLVKSEYGITYCSVLTSNSFVRTDEEVKKETHSSSTGDLNELIKLLLELRPHVETMAEYLKGVDRSAMTDSDKAMESVLAAYCTFALAADEPFDVLKGPEALDEAVLDEPLTIPEKAETTILDGKAIMAGTLMIGYVGSGTNLLLPEGIEDILVMDLDVPETNAYHKAETITYPKSLTAKSIKIPYNVKKVVFNHDAEEFSAEPQEKSWDDPGQLTSLIYKGTIKKIGGCCWLASKNVTYVELPKGLKFFGRYAFNGVTNLEQITFPETVEGYDEEIFSRHIYKSLTITAYAGTPSEKVARELASKEEGITCNIVISPEEQARRAREQEEKRRAEAERRRQEEEQRRLAAEKRAAEINAAIMKLRQERVAQEKIVAENGGLFGEKARKRKAAKEQIASIDAQIAQLERSK